MSRETVKGKSTAKLDPKSIGVIGDMGIETDMNKLAQALGAELARSGHIACFASANRFSQIVAKNVIAHGGTTIHYCPVIQKSIASNTSPEAWFTHQVVTHEDYENTLLMMMRSIDGIILAPFESTSLNILTFPIPSHLHVSVLTNDSDLSPKLLNIMQATGATDPILNIDSSPSQLIKRMAKQLRQQQLSSLKS